MTFLDFFAGIGGFRRGLELAGHKCLGFCEWDKYAVASYTSMHCITDEQRSYLSTLDLKHRQKEILKDEYRNGEWYAADIRSVDTGSLPRADCWCFGFPCQDISVAGKQVGFRGNRSSLFFATTKLIRDLEEKDRPELLLIENVKNLLSVNRGFDFARLLIELDEIGYDAEWQVLNSKDFGVPQNRERIYIVGHLRGRSATKVFPIEESGGENRVQEIGRLKGGSKCLQTYSPDGIAGTISTASGGGNEPHVAQFCDLDYEGELTTTDNARALKARYYKGASKHKAQDSGVVVPIGGLYADASSDYQRGILDDMSRSLKGEVHDCSVALGVVDSQGRKGKKVSLNDTVPTLRAQAHGNNPEITLKINNGTKQGYSEAHEGDGITLSWANNSGYRGRVGKKMAHTLQTSANQGTMVKIDNDFDVYATWREEYQCYIAIRKLTPRECFRLQGWSDDYFDKAQFVNSDSQLYKQAGNGVTVNVVQAIGERMK